MGRDSQYKRLRYVRYADDFLLGVIGSKEDCTEIIGCLEKWLKSERDLVLNLDKTKITHSRDDSASFLGYNIHLTKSYKKPRRHVVVNNKHKLSLLTPRPLAPTNECVKKLTEQGYARGNGAPTKCGRLIHLTAGDIVRHYLTLEQGLLAYYGISSNFGHFSARIHYILKYSCALTLCSKLRLRTLRKTFRKFGKNLTILKENGEIDIEFRTRKGHYAKPRRKAGFPQLAMDPAKLISDLSKRISRGRTDLHGECTLCGAVNNIEIHHRLSKGKSSDYLTHLQQRMNRKQLCKPCHIKVHQGK